MRRAARQNAGAAGAFDPIADVGWGHAYWAEGDEMVAQGYADTDAVGTWPDEVGTTDLTEATNKPTYRSSVAALNNLPAVDFDGSNDVLKGTWSQSQPLSVVWIGKRDGAGGGASGGERVVDIGSPSSSYTNAAMSTQTGKWTSYAGSIADSTVSHDTNKHLGVWFFSGSSSYILIDATNTNTNPGTGGADRLWVAYGSAFEETGNIHAAFVGVYAGDVASDGGWTDFKAWVTDHYGITT